MEITKGDWTVFKNMGMGSELFPKGHHQIVGNNQGDNIALVPTHWANAEANAHLIAAVSNLYEACKHYDLAIGKAIMAFYQDEPMTNIVEKILLPAQEQGRKAIAKAEME